MSSIKDTAYLILMNILIFLAHTGVCMFVYKCAAYVVSFNLPHLTFIDMFALRAILYLLTNDLCEFAYIEVEDEEEK